MPDNCAGSGGASVPGAVKSYSKAKLPNDRKKQKPLVESVICDAMAGVSQMSPSCFHLLKLQSWHSQVQTLFCRHTWGSSGSCDGPCCQVGSGRARREELLSPILCEWTWRPKWKLLTVTSIHSQLSGNLDTSGIFPSFGLMCHSPMLLRQMEKSYIERASRSVPGK